MLFNEASPTLQQNPLEIARLQVLYNRLSAPNTELSAVNDEIEPLINTEAEKTLSPLKKKTGHLNQCQ